MAKAKLTIAIQMDDPATLKVDSDSTIVLALEAQKRGYEVYAYLPEALSAGSGAIIAQPAHPIIFHENGPEVMEIGEPQTLNLSDVDVILVRQDPPFDMAYITTTYLLERLPDTLVVNNPSTLRNASEKLSIMQFPEAIPPTLVTRDLTLIDAFRQEHHELIVKPLYGYGGRSVYRFARDDSNLNTLLEEWFTQSREPVMIQPYLKEVLNGDIRVIMMNGVVSAAVGRIPAAGEIRANFRVGGTAAKVELNRAQKRICERVGRFLKESGVIFAGLDLIGDYLTEINITSPTGLKAAMMLYGKNPAIHFWDAVEAKLNDPTL